VFCYFDNSHKINTFAVGCTLTVSAYEKWQNIKKTNCPQQGVWRQAGRGLVGHFAGIWEFCSRPSLCETPPDAKPQTRCMQWQEECSSLYQNVDLKMCGKSYETKEINLNKNKKI